MVKDETNNDWGDSCEICGSNFCTCPDCHKQNCPGAHPDDEEFGREHCPICGRLNKVRWGAYEYDVCKHFFCIAGDGETGEVSHEFDLAFQKFQELALELDETDLIEIANSIEISETFVEDVDSDPLTFLKTNVKFYEGPHIDTDGFSSGTIFSLYTKENQKFSKTIRDIKRFTKSIKLFIDQNQ